MLAALPFVPPPWLPSLHGLPPHGDPGGGAGLCRNPNGTHVLVELRLFAFRGQLELLSYVVRRERVSALSVMSKSQKL